MSVVIIGGGAAGMCAAVAAARAGERVTVFEKTDRVGKKLLATGNGRCNITNEEMDPCHFHGTNESFITAVLQQILPQTVEEFWESLGLELITLEQGRRYPASLQASTVLDALRSEMQRLGVDIVCDSPVDQILPQKRHLRLMRGGQEICRCDRVILCAGGKASPQLGADGSGMNLAKGLHLSTLPLRPAIVKLSCDSPWLKSLAGCRWIARAVLYAREADGCSDTGITQSSEPLAEAEGEVLFTAEGLSGPAILALAREALEPGRKTEIRLHLLPEQNKSSLYLLLMGRAARFSYMSIAQMLGALINKRMVLPLLKSSRIDPERECGDIKKKEMSRLAEIMLSWTFPVTGDGGWREAQVTVGGIDTQQIDPRTMECRKIPGLFIAGEVMDVDGDCGGYNLHWAACTGILAGRSAAAETESH